MSNGNEKPLGRRLLQTLDEITALIEVTHDPERLNELEKLSSKLTHQIGALVETNLNSASAEYQAATRGLADASAQIQSAMKGLDSVVNAIASISKALDLVAELAA
jgi:chromosome segregation ATPase